MSTPNRTAPDSATAAAPPARTAPPSARIASVAAAETPSAPAAAASAPTAPPAAATASTASIAVDPAADLAVRDLTDPASGPHAMQLLVAEILAAVPAPLLIHRGDRIVDVTDNYDKLGYSSVAAARDSRYSRYITPRRMLRSQTSALIPGALRALRPLATEPGTTHHDLVIACPGIVYRRDAIDRLHTGTPHQLDLWRLTTAPGTRAELLELVATVLGAALPGTPWRTRPATHPYTTDGLELEALSRTGWVEVGECGQAAAHVLRLSPTPLGGGLALGLGLDRLLMLRKGIDDIRLLRSTEPRVAAQMTDLAPYRPVSAQPAAYRDLSVAAPADVTAEDLGDRVRDLLGADAHLVEEVTILSVTPCTSLPPASRARLRLREDEANVLLRVVLRDLHAALPRQRANALRDRLWSGLMAGRTPHPASG